MNKKIMIYNLEELINQRRKVKYDIYEFDELSYTCLLLDIKMLILENKKYKEVIEELSEVIHEIDESRKLTNGFPSDYIDCLVNILKEVKND